MHVQGGKAFRRHISDHVHKEGAGAHTFLDAVEHVPEDIRRGTALSDNPKAPYPFERGKRPSSSGDASSDCVSSEVPAGVQQL